MRQMTIIGLLLLLLLWLTACKDRELSYALQAEVTVTADWSGAGMEEESNYGATLLFYPQDGGEPRLALMGDRRQATLRLAKGSYDVILFNRSFDDFGSVAFRGQDRLETLEAYARKVETRTGTRIIVSPPEKIAAAVMRDFDVEQEKCRLHLGPVLLTRKMEVRLNVKGLQNVRRARCVLQGMPLSMLLHNGRAGSETGGQEFALGNPAFEPGSLTDGALTGTLNTFGAEEGTLHAIEVEVLLVDGKTIVKQTMTDISFKEETDGEGNIVIRLEADIPEPLPDVKPEGGSGSGFDADVDDWDEEHTQEVPV